MPRKRRNNIPSFSCFRGPWAGAALSVLLLLALALPARAQTFSFSLRADPDVIPANGVSTASILVQVENTSNAAISASPIARFSTTAGTIESQTRLSGGIARVLLRSAATPGTAVVTVFIGSAREEIAVEFADDTTSFARYMRLSADYVAYGTDVGLVTASGKCEFSFGDTHIQSDVRLDIDLNKNELWAEGNAGGVVIRQGAGAHAAELRGDRLYYDLHRRRGVIRRSDAGLGPPRQEFMGSDLGPLPSGSAIGETGVPIIAPPPPPAAAVSQIVGSQSSPVAAAPVAAAASPRAESPPQIEPPIGTTEKHVGLLNLTGPKSDADPIGLSLSTHDTDGGGLRLQTPPPSVSVTTTMYKIVAPPDGEIKAETPADTGLGGVPPVDPRHAGDTGPQAPLEIPDYHPLARSKSTSEQIIEPMPPVFDVNSSYWVAARRLNIYPHDKIQFEHATLFYNGGKVFSMPRYVVPLNGAFNPGQNALDFNSSGGLTLNIPYYYQASPGGQGTLFFQHAPSNGFAAETPGFALALQQQYWLSPNSSGQLVLDQLGHDWNLDWEHKMQINPTTAATISLDMPQHSNAYLHSTLLKDFTNYQVGIEGFYSRPTGSPNDFQGQFYARLRPRALGASGWSYTVSANASMWQRYPEIVTLAGTSLGGAGGIGIPGFLGVPSVTSTTNYQRVFGQTVDFALQAPTHRLWKGGTFTTSLGATAFNQSLGQRGIAPSMAVGIQQSLNRWGSFQLDYTYNRSADLFAVSDLTNLLTGTLTLTPTKRLSATGQITQSLSDHSFYASTELDYAIGRKWRAGLFSDYSTFADIIDGPPTDTYLDYGWTLGRLVGQRELTLNWSHQRNQIYFELGGFQL